MNDFRDNCLAEVELLLRQRIGLNPEAFSKNHIQDAVGQCLAASEDVSEYLMRIRTNDDDFQELVERLIVPESWFFRDVEPFRCVDHWLGQRSTSFHQPIRILSVPCGSGEEPYSIAMTLLTAGLSPDQVMVDAVDISQRVLRQARDGCYGELSFRERIEPVAGFRDRWFRRVDQRWVVNDEVRAGVHFRQANVVGPNFLEGEEPYQVIFCRNLLIYLDNSARRLTLANLHRLLASDGLLYVGHVEAGAVPADLFGRYGDEFPFAFQPTRAAVERQMVVPVAAATPLKVAAALPKARPTERQTTPVVGDAQAELAKARQAADCGRLADAQSQCLELLTKYPPRADVYCLLGVVHQANGESSEAQKCFHKALYLDPRHHESLVHAELLARQRGEEQLAQQYRRRAERRGVS